MLRHALLAAAIAASFAGSAQATTINDVLQSGQAFSFDDQGGEFVIGDVTANAGTPLSLFGGSGLFDTGYGGDTVTLDFAAPITSLTLTFVVGDPLGLGFNGNDIVTLVENGNVTNATGTLQASGYPEGSVTINDAAGFSSISISSVYGFGLAVPEPASLAALGAGLVALGLIRRRVA